MWEKPTQAFLAAIMWQTVLTVAFPSEHKSCWVLKAGYMWHVPDIQREK